MPAGGSGIQTFFGEFFHDDRSSSNPSAVIIHKGVCVCVSLHFVLGDGVSQHAMLPIAGLPSSDVNAVLLDARMALGLMYLDGDVMSDKVRCVASKVRTPHVCRCVEHGVLVLAAVLGPATCRC